MARNNRQTGPTAASNAAKVLSNPKSTKAEKSAAASALSHTPMRILCYWWAWFGSLSGARPTLSLVAAPPVMTLTEQAPVLQSREAAVDPANDVVGVSVSEVVETLGASS